ncbi:MAG: hypothetical protein AAGA03_05415 [Planctomycetota bacterium]
MDPSLRPVIDRGGLASAKQTLLGLKTMDLDEAYARQTQNEVVDRPSLSDGELPTVPRDCCLN